MRRETPLTPEQQAAFDEIARLGKKFRDAEAKMDAAREELQKAMAEAGKDDFLKTRHLADASTYETAQVRRILQARGVDTAAYYASGKRRGAHRIKDDA
ncbi:hypothetical protein [Streptomyces chilikensis]|uniref:Uncharacterized protein n=1 Tax=Streptomyces chilikensis TaxID=1194079 RepID=A0ABV3EJA8_9ACTN